MATIRYLFVTLLLATSFLVSAQESQESFGKNRLQYKAFNWRQYSSDNFDVHFYDNGQEAAKMAAEYLEEEFDRITDLIGYAPYAKTKIFLYNSVHDLQQSNVGLNENNFTIGGQTNFVKLQVEIAHTGDIDSFKKELLYKLSDILIRDMMFGGSFSDMLQSAYLLSLPEWFIEGATHYIAKGWSIEMDDYMRDMVARKRIKKATRLRGEEAALAGQSIWNYIAENYGRGNISNILNLTRIIRNEESSIVNTLGVPFRIFLEDWQRFYQVMDEQLAEEFVLPSDDFKVRRKNRKGYVYHQVRYSPDGRHFAYSENDNGRYTVYVKNVETGKRKKITKGGYKVIDQQVDKEVPLLSWKDDNVLGVIRPKSGNYGLWLYDLNSSRSEFRDLQRFDQITAFDFAGNGNIYVVSAMVKGQSDIFLLNVNRPSVRRVTNDRYDDLHPRFIPGENAVVFSSNRVSDSLNSKSVPSLKEIEQNFNLFVYHVDTTDQVLSRLTNTISKDIKPIPMNNREFYYLSDQKGIWNIFRFRIEERMYQQVTSFKQSVLDYDIGNEEQLGMIMYNEGNATVYHLPQFDFNKNVFSPQSPRQDRILARNLTRKLREERNAAGRQDTIRFGNRASAQPSLSPTEEEALRSTDALENAGQISVDSAVFQQDIPLNGTIVDDAADPGLINTDEYSFDVDFEDFEITDDELIEQEEIAFEDGTGIIDTENYTFDLDPEELDTPLEEQREDRRSQRSFLAQYRSQDRQSRILGPFPYQSRFSTDNLITSWVIDPLRGFGIQLEIQLNDQLENHRFYGGLLAITDLQSGDLFAEYQYLKNRVDLHVRYDRRSIVQSSNDFTDPLNQKYVLDKFQVGASLPLSTKFRLSGAPFLAITNFFDRDNMALSPNFSTEGVLSSTNIYTGLSAQAVYDNTQVKGLNIFTGTRGRIKFDHYQGIDSTAISALNTQTGSFSNISMDLRHYQPIHKELIFATRLFYGRNFGPNRQRYLLGGMNNWLFNSTDAPTSLDNPLATTSFYDNSDILFTEFVTNLRGFNYNRLNGNNAMILNAELRFPIIQYFSSGPISSNFLRNLQFIGFFDVGSAWDGSEIYPTENSLNREVIQVDGSPFEAVIKNFGTPWLASYGAGIRTVLLGYYIKFDTAWPIENYEVSNPKFYLTLGYDF